MVVIVVVREKVKMVVLGHGQRSEGGHGDKTV